ncbi:MAG: four helix bundle protein [Candidatus Yanofskybacteria bacterium]|nr:four helix bundle protein [Candidatus Yanofskybacteria bacterium]
MIKTFRELKVWQRAHELTLLTYKLARDFPTEEKYGLSSQMRRAAASVASNIVEGFRRYSNKMSNSFYDIADGSLEELKYQLLLSLDLNYISESDYNNAIRIAEEVSKMLHSWAKTQK